MIVSSAPIAPVLPGTSSGNYSMPLPMAVPSPLAILPSVSPAHFIPANVKKDILDGKDINLASLLIASQDVENKSHACGEVSVVLKTREPRLNRKLSIAEFVLAFGIYRDVICAVNPGRREEMDSFIHKVVDLAY